MQDHRRIFAVVLAELQESEASEPEVLSEAEFAAAESLVQLEAAAMALQLEVRPAPFAYDDNQLGLRKSKVKNIVS